MAVATSLGVLPQQGYYVFVSQKGPIFSIGESNDYNSCFFFVAPIRGL